MSYEGQITTNNQTRPQITKVWGHEDVVVNIEQYCGKILYLNPGYQSSFHLHEVKDETFVCIEGEVLVEYGEEKHMVVLRGATKDAIRLAPGVPHRFMAASRKGAILVEFSTTHKDNDVVRLVESREI